jgi:hypothetical protein
MARPGGYQPSGYPSSKRHGDKKQKSVFHAGSMHRMKNLSRRKLRARIMPDISDTLARFLLFSERKRRRDLGGCEFWG